MGLAVGAIQCIYTWQAPHRPPLGHQTNIVCAHQVDIQLLSREVGNPNQKPGRNYLENYEKGAVKDIAVLGDNEAVQVLAKFVPYEGVYIFHCHNIVHEDFSMVGRFPCLPITFGPY